MLTFILPIFNQNETVINMNIWYFKLHDIVCTCVAFIPYICVEFHITCTLISSGLIRSELISSGVSIHMHVAGQQLLRSNVAEHTCVEEGGINGSRGGVE